MIAIVTIPFDASDAPCIRSVWTNPDLAVLSAQSLHASLASASHHPVRVVVCGIDANDAAPLLHILSHAWRPDGSAAAIPRYLWDSELADEPAPLPPVPTAPALGAAQLKEPRWVRPRFAYLTGGRVMAPTKKVGP